jgi:hypothetical protein
MTAEDGHPNSPVLPDRGGPCGQLIDEPIIERIAEVRTVEGPALDRAVAANREEFVSHGDITAPEY